MALVVKDRVKETTTTTGTGTITLAGASQGFQSFSVIGNGNTTYYTIVDPATGDWEVGVGTYTSSGTTLSRTTVLESSNAGSLVPFGSGTKDVFVTYPAERSVYLDTAGSAVTVLDVGTLGTSTANITTANITSGTVSTTPTSSTDIANKTYVDNLVASGTSYHTPVKYEVPNTTGNLNALYNNGTGGVGATLTNNGTLAAFAPDGPTASVNDRILIYNQTNAYENGVYEVTTVGSGSVAWVLTRTADADSYGLKDPNALGNGDAFFVTSGNTGAGETYICNTTGVITFGTTAITFAQISSAQVYSAGTGISLSPSTTINIANTGVSASTYGSASAVPVFAVNAQGQITSVTNTNIAISGSAVSGNISGSAGSVANALTAGTYLTSGGTFDGSAARTFAVDATSANTASKVVARDASGNFSAGTITATLSGAATSATTATNLAGGVLGDIPYQSAAGTTAFLTGGTNGYVLKSNGAAAPTWTAATISGVQLGNNLNTLTLGSYLTGTSYNGSAAVTAAVDATSANTASKVVARDASGNFSAGTITASLSGNATSATSASTSTTQAKSDASTNIATTAFSKQLFYSPSTAGTLDWNDVSNTRPGAGATLLLGSATNGPGGGNYYIPFNYEYSSFDGTGNVTQTAIAYGSPGNELWMRGRYSGSWSSWVRFLNSNNYNSYSPTLTGTGASGTWGINITGNASTATTASNVNNGTLTMNVSGTGLSGSQTFTANQSSNVTFTVTSNATSANTASTIVARDASGNFSAGTITASLSGNATTATTATNQSGGTVNATSVTTSGPIYRSAAGAGYLNGQYPTYESGSTSGAIYSIGGAYVPGTTSLGNMYGIGYGYSGNAGITATGAPGGLWGMYVASGGVSRIFFDADNGRGFFNGAIYSAGNIVLNAGNYNSYSPTLTGTGASGTWGINITGNAANITAYTINQSVGTGNNVQHNSLGIGTAASGTAGEIRATNNVTAYYSDDRLKTKLGGIEKALEKLLTLEGFYYEANQTAQDLGYVVKREVGVSAQQVQRVLPEAVTSAPIDDKYLTVWYERLIPLLIQAVKELHAEVQDLKGKINVQ